MGPDQEKALSKTSSPGSAVREEFQGKVEMQRAEQAAIYVAAQAKAEIESAFLVALKMPRNRDQARIEILAACKNPTFAELALYSKPVGGRAIVGPSIRFAEEMIRAWKNVKIQSMVIFEDAERRMTSINIVDLENNISYSPKITIEKTVERRNATGREVVGERLNTNNQRVFIVKATDDEIRNKENALLSKEIRNSSLRLIPQDIIEDAKIQIRETLKAGAKADPAKAKKQVLDSFATIGVQPKKLEEYLKHSIDTASPAEIADLRAVYKSIADGQAIWKDYVDKEAISTEAKVEEVDLSAGDLKPGDEKTHQSVKEPVKKAGQK